MRHIPWLLYLKFTRPFTLIPPALGMMSGSIVALGATSGTSVLGQNGAAAVAIKILSGALVASLLNAASNSLNQIFDLDIDKINKPKRPLPSGAMTICEAWYVTIALYVISLSVAYLLDPMFGHIVGVTTLFTIAYSAPPLRTKRHWLLAAFTIAIPRGVLLKVAGWCLVRDIYAAEPWYLGGIFGLFLVGANNTKDYADIVGDRREHCLTLPVRFGIRRSILMIAPFFIVPFLLLPGGVYWHILTGSSILLNLLGLSLALWGIYVVSLLLHDPESLAATENHPSWTHMYLMMMYAQIGLALAYIIRV